MIGEGSQRDLRWGVQKSVSAGPGVHISSLDISINGSVFFFLLLVFAWLAQPYADENKEQGQDEADHQEEEYPHQFGQTDVPGGGDKHVVEVALHLTQPPAEAWTAAAVEGAVGVHTPTAIQARHI